MRRLDEIVFTKIIGDFALLFGVLSYFYSFEGSTFQSSAEVSGIIYIAMSALIFCVYLIRKKSKILSCIFLPALILPFFIVRAAGIKVNDSFVVFTIIFSVYIILLVLDKLSYYYCRRDFKIGLTVIFIVLFIAFLGSRIYIFNSYAVPYVIIYFISEIMLLRSLRYVECSGTNGYLNKYNFKYTVFVAAAAFILSIKPIVDFLKYVFISLIHIIANSIFYLFYWAIKATGYLVQYIILCLKRAEGRNKGLTIVQKGSVFKNKNKIPNIDIVASFMNNYFFRIAIEIIFLLIAMFIIMRALMKNYSSAKKKADYYVESREFIKKGDGRNFFKNLSGILKSHDKTESIRYYYYKFLMLCVHKGVKIKKSDTTSEINIKSEEYFNNEKGTLDDFRNIYLKDRYSEKVTNQSIIKRFSEKYKKLKSI